MINFIIGRSGSGKSRTVVDMISNEIQNTTRPVVLLVPEQQTVVWETKMSTLLPPSANLRLEITNFTRLSNSVFREYGGLVDTVIDEGSRSLLVWRAMLSVWEHLTVYNGGHEDRNIPHLMNAIDELKSGGVTPGMAEEALRQLRLGKTEDGERSGDLISRLSDAVMVYGAYEALLHEEYIDRGDLLTNLASLLDTKEYFRGKAVFIDSFFSLTKPEERILARIIRQAEDLTVTFACPPEASGAEEIQFGEVREFLKSTAAMAAKSGKEISKIPLTENRRHESSPELAAVEKYLFNYTETIPAAEGNVSPSEAVKIVRCADKFDEAEACAAIIEKLLRDGYRNSDIAVVAGNMSSREGIIDTVLRRHGIDCFMSEPGSVSTSPAVKLVLSALGVAVGGWQRKNVIRLLKTGMTPAGRVDTPADTAEKFEGDIFETYTGTWNIHGRRSYTGDDWCMNPDGYSASISDNGREILRLANSAKNKIIPPLDRLLSAFDGGAAEVREICERIVYFAEEYGVEDTLFEMAEAYRSIGMPADGDKTEASWTAVCEILDKMVKMLGDTRLDASRFSGLFARVAASMDVGTIPTGIDEVVLGSATGVRFDTVKCVIILGSVEGEFPGAVSDGGSFFGESDKLMLESVGLELGSLDTEAATAREYFMYYRSASAPTEKLYVLAPTGNGDELSEGALRIKKIMEAAGRDSVSTFAAMPLSEVLFSKAGAEYQVSRRKDPAEVALLKKLIGESGDSVAKIPLTAEKERIVGWVTGGRMSLSQTRINSFVQCPFNYSCKYLMNIRPEPKAEIGNMDVGTFIHHIMEKFFTETPKSRLTAGDLTTGEIHEISERIISDYLAQLEEGSGKERDGRIEYLFIRLKRYVPVFLEALLREMSQSEFVPVAYELPMGLGESGNVPPITFTIEDGTEVSLNGVADRVDLYEKDGKKYIRVVDYKTGAKTFDMQKIAKGIDIQLLIYLFTLWKFGIPSMGITGDVIPAGAVYFIARPTVPSVAAGISPEDAVELTINKIVRSGVYLADEDSLRAMDRELSGKYAGAKDSKGVIKVSTKANALMSIEELGQLYTQLEEIIKNVATDMKAGKADASPLRDGKNYPCAWCDNKYICKAAKKSGEEE